MSFFGVFLQPEQVESVLENSTTGISPISIGRGAKQAPRLGLSRLYACRSHMIMLSSTFASPRAISPLLE
jgi:hypothetical protein